MPCTTVEVIEIPQHYLPNPAEVELQRVEELEEKGLLRR